MLSIIMSLFISCSWAWTPYETKLYTSRQFLELEHTLFMKRDAKHVKVISKQAEDLAGCKAIHEGSGRVQSFIKCVRFLNREHDLKLYSPQRSTLVGDLNLICHQFAGKKDFIEKVLKEEDLFKPRKEWVSCHSEIWQQVYLTAYANFLADPVGTLALSRKAERNLGPDQHWSVKIKQFMSRR